MNETVSRQNVGTADDHAATSEKGASMVNRDPETVASQSDKPLRQTRFTYPSGSRPLDGYTIKRGIGAGGFGEVYFALNDAGKEVALKRIQRNMDIELRGVRQCLNLKHINLIKLWDIRNNEAGEAWVVMEYVPGESLRDIIERYPQGMPEPALREWFESTCAGVAYLHDRGIVHRDLKPGNIFRDNDENVIKIGDYGLSKFISCSNRDGQTETVGTFHYMAPEIGKGVYGREIDIYALGIILYEMLTGRVPFEGESSQEIIMKHLTAIPDLSLVPERFAPVVRKALEKDPARRFPDVPALLDALENPQPESRDANRPSATPHELAAVRPPVRPMFIGDGPVADAGIRFGELRNAAPGVPGGAQGPHDNLSPAATHVITGNEPAEPIARAVHRGWRGALDWWHQSTLGTPIKTLIVAGIVVMLLINSPWLLPTAAGLGVMYLIYYTIRAIFVDDNAESSPRKLTKAEMRARLRYAIATRPAGDRTTELVGSLVASAILCLLLGFFALLALPTDADSVVRWSWYVWTSVTAIVGSWIVLMTCKTWEHREGEALPRRFTMAALGAITGAAAWAMSQFLHLQWHLPHEALITGLSPLPEQPFLDGTAPSLVGAILFFAVLFLVLRWWRQADPVRRSRLSLWNVGLCLVWGALIGEFFHFPLPWCSITAVMISVATQIAAPWMAPAQREQLIYSHTQ